MKTRNTVFIILFVAILLITGGFLVENKGVTNGAMPAGNASLLKTGTSATSMTHQPANSQVTIPIISTSKGNGGSTALGHILVYKTKQDYSNLVWVQLSPDKTKITAYPAPTDIVQQTPTALHNGYYTGSVGLNTTFINITIPAYSKMTELIPEEQMYSLIVDKNPLSELYDCGIRGSTSIAVINQLIDVNQLSTSCTRIL